MNQHHHHPQQPEARNHNTAAGYPPHHPSQFQHPLPSGAEASSSIPHPSSSLHLVDRVAQTWISNGRYPPPHPSGTMTVVPNTNQGPLSQIQSSSIKDIWGGEGSALPLPSNPLPRVPMGTDIWSSSAQLPPSYGNSGGGMGVNMTPSDYPMYGVANTTGPHWSGPSYPGMPSASPYPPPHHLGGLANPPGLTHPPPLPPHYHPTTGPPPGLVPGSGPKVMMSHHELEAQLKRKMQGKNARPSFPPSLPQPPSHDPSLLMNTQLNNGYKLDHSAPRENHHDQEDLVEKKTIVVSSSPPKIPTAGPDAISSSEPSQMTKKQTSIDKPIFAKKVPENVPSKTKAIDQMPLNMSDFPALNEEGQRHGSASQKRDPKYKEAVTAIQEKRIIEDYGSVGGSDLQSESRTTVEMEPQVEKPRVEKYRGLMTQRDKDYILRMQMSQLVTNDPNEDDFYYQIFNSLKSTSPTQEIAAASSRPAYRRTNKNSRWQQALLVSSKGHSMHVTKELQQRMQRLIENRKHHPKALAMTKEGALGKIALTSAKNPRVMISVASLVDDDNVDDMGKSRQKETVTKGSFLLDAAPSSSLQILHMIEQLYYHVLSLERLEVRSQVVTQKDLRASVQETMAEHKADLWALLAIPGFDDAVSNAAHHTSPLLQALCYGKGKRVLPRFVNWLNMGQQEALWLHLVDRMDELDVTHVLVNQPTEQVDVFSQNVTPTLAHFVANAPFAFIIRSLDTILHPSRRTKPLSWVTGSKFGLVLLTLLLSRGEILKAHTDEPVVAVEEDESTRSAAEQPSAEQLESWKTQFSHLFKGLESKFRSIFLAPAPDTPAPYHPEEVYIWQFLSAMAVSASDYPEHQKHLVLQVRQIVQHRIAEGQVSSTSQTAGPSVPDPRALENVNLFLTALGLGIDASQLMLG